MEEGRAHGVGLPPAAPSSTPAALAWPLTQSRLRAGLYTNIGASIVALLALACGCWLLGGVIFLIQVSTLLRVHAGCAHALLDVPGIPSTLTSMV